MMRINDCKWLASIMVWMLFQGVFLQAKNVNSWRIKESPMAMPFHIFQRSDASFPMPIIAGTDKSAVLCDSAIYISALLNMKAKYIYTYNTQGLVLSVDRYEKYDNNSPYILSSKHNCAYDQNNHKTLDEEIVFEINYDLYQNRSSRYVATYDANGRLQSEVNYNCDESNSVWSEVSKVQYDYSTDGSVIHILQYTKDDQLNLWQLLSAQTRIIHSKYHISEEEDWYDVETKNIVTNIKTNKYLNVFMQDSLSTTDCIYDTSDLSPSYSTESEVCTYNSAHQLVNKSHYSYEPGTETWKLLNEELREFNTVGNIVRHIYNNMMNNDNTRIEYDYNDKDQLISVAGFKNDEVFMKELYNYDDAGNIANAYYYSLSKNELKFSTKGTYYYPGSSGFFVDSSTRDNIYPNPAKTYFQINGLNEMAMVTIYNSQGKACKVLKVYQNEPIFVDNLQGGCYVVTVKTASKSFSQRLLVE